MATVEPIVIDAAAGGQVFRSALGLSALLSKPVKIVHIRSSRPKPGLQPQHLTVLKTLQQVARAKVEGAVLNSDSVLFVPSALQDSQLVANIGTAGSVALLLQSFVFPSLVCNNRLRVLGGTNVPFAPSFEFLEQSFFPALKSLGGRFDVSLNAHGFFPKGNGAVSFVSKPAKFPLKPLYWVELGKLESVEGFSVCASLPPAVAENQARSVEKTLSVLDCPVLIHRSCKETASSKGSSMVLFARFSSGRVLSSASLGKKELSSEKVGKMAAEQLLKKIRDAKPMDVHLADQLVPFLALAKGASTFETAVLSDHLLNNIKVCEQLLPVKFEVKGEKGKPCEVFVEGSAFVPSDAQKK